MSRRQKSLSSLSSKKRVSLLGGPYCYPWFCEKRMVKGTERKRKGKEKSKGKRKGKGKGLYVVWGYFLNKWVSLRYRYNFASCTYATLCKTTSDVDIIHNYRYHFWGGPIATQCLAHLPDTRELSFTKVVHQSFQRTFHVQHINMHMS